MEEIQNNDTRVEELINQFPVDIKKVPITDVFPNKWNPNKESDFIFKKLVESVKKIGFVVPVLVREIPTENTPAFEIIDGEHKWTAARELGYTEILIANMGVVDELKAKALTISMNNIKGDDDPLKLAEILKQIKAGQQGLFGFLPYEEKEMEETMKLLDFDFSQFAKMQIDDPTEVDEIKKILGVAMTLKRLLGKLHSKTKNTQLRLYIEAFNDWVMQMEGNQKLFS